MGRAKEKIQKLCGRIMCIKNKIHYNKNVYISPTTKIIHNGGITLYDNIKIRGGCRLYATNKGQIKIGENSEIGENSTISSHNMINIGEGVLTGPHVFISDHNHAYENPNAHIYTQGVKWEENDRVEIGDGSWLGTNTVITGNIKIGKQCVIGANSVVCKDIPDYCVAVGIPAKIIKRYNFETGSWERVH